VWAHDVPDGLLKDAPVLILGLGVTTYDAPNKKVRVLVQ
jgi:hypothetical protein